MFASKVEKESQIYLDYVDANSTTIILIRNISRGTYSQYTSVGSNSIMSLTDLFFIIHQSLQYGVYHQQRHNELLNEITINIASILLLAEAGWRCRIDNNNFLS